MTRYPLKSIAEMSDVEWERAFPDEETCMEWLVNSRWPDEKRCPRCGSDLVFPASLHEYRWRCFGCVPDLGYPFDHLSGTIFQDSPFPLRVWLKVLHNQITGKIAGHDASEQNMRRHIRDAMREPGFRGMVGEPSAVPPSIREPPDAQTLFAPQEQSCQEPARLTVLRR